MSTLKVRLMSTDIPPKVISELTERECDFLRAVILAEFNRASANIQQASKRLFGNDKESQMLHHEQMDTVRDGYSYRKNLFDLLNRLDGARVTSSNGSMIVFGSKYPLTKQQEKTLHRALVQIGAGRLDTVNFGHPEATTTRGILVANIMHKLFQDNDKL